MSELINRKTEKEKRKDLRNNMPKPEQILWYFLRKRQLNGVKFRRQVSIGEYIVDFYSFERKLVIEIDGDSHFLDEKSIEYDKKRTKYLENLGLKIMRFYNTDVMKNRKACANKILEFLEKE
jgi:very-short-patch-repair endonuclease